MKLHTRLERLERAIPKPMPLTEAERLQRLRFLIEYRGDDPDILWRRERLAELFAKAWKRHKAAAEKSKKS